MRPIEADALVKEIHRLKEKASTFGNSDYKIGYISALSTVEGMIALSPILPILRREDGSGGTA